MQRKKWGLLAAGLAAIAGLSLSAAPAHATLPCDGGTKSSTSKPFGVCYPQSGGGAIQDNNNVWGANNPANNDTDAAQTLTPTSRTAWSVSANMDSTISRIVSYPEASFQFKSTDRHPVNWFGRITSSWNTTLPGSPGSSDSYEFAYDLWMGNLPGGSGALEVMVWTDNHGQHQGGSEVVTSWPDPTYGNVYSVWVNSTTVWFVPASNKTSGSADLQAAMQEAITAEKGAWPANPNVYELDYGVEIVSTSDKAETFKLNSYALNIIGGIL